MKFNSVWQSLPFVELIDVDKVEAKCSGIQSGCTIKSTKDKRIKTYHVTKNALPFLKRIYNFEKLD